MNNEKKCPLCNSPMVLRTARYGPHRGKNFYGCSRYPDCRGLIPYEDEDEDDINEDEDDITPNDITPRVPKNPDPPSFTPVEFEEQQTANTVDEIIDYMKTELRNSIKPNYDIDESTFERRRKIIHSCKSFGEEYIYSINKIISKMEKMGAYIYDETINYIAKLNDEIKFIGEQMNKSTPPPPDFDPSKGGPDYSK